MIYRAEVHWNDGQIDVLNIGATYHGKEITSLDFGGPKGPNVVGLNITFKGGKNALVMGVPFVTFDDDANFDESK